MKYYICAGQGLPSRKTRTICLEDLKTIGVGIDNGVLLVLLAQWR